MSMSQQPALPAPRASARPAVRQQSAMDCGAACLATVCRYYGKVVSLNRLRDLTRVGRNGASMRDLLLAARELGFETHALVGTWDHLAANHRPALVNWKGVHWIVVYDVRADGVTLADPAQGLVTMTRAEFEEGWTRYVLYLRATPRFAAVEDSPPRLARFRAYVAPFRPLLREALLAALLLQVFQLSIPVFSKFLVDGVVIRRETDAFVPAVVAMAVIMVLQGAVGFVRQRLVLGVAQRVSVALIRDFYAHALALPLRFFEDRRVGDVVSRFGENLTLTRFFTGPAVDVFVDGVSVVAYVCLMLSMDARLTVIALLVLAAQVANLQVLTPRLQTGFREIFQRSTDVRSHVLESVAGLRTIKLLAIERFMRWTFEDALARFVTASFATQKLSVASQVLGQLANQLGSVGLTLAAGWLVLTGRLSLGEMVAFTLLFSGLQAPVGRLVNAWDELQRALNAVERLGDVLEAPLEEGHAPAGRRVVTRLRGHVRFEDVTFRYDDTGRNVLQAFDLEVAPGSTVALVGRSGSGKSTFMKLLLGLYRPTAGRIVVDGFDVRELWLPGLRRQVGIVPQEVHLFQGTVRENIALGRPGASAAEVREAARLAGAHDFIVTLPAGYDTVMLEGGANLSGGQRQRVAIARTLLQQPSVLLLDEATSALDNEAERAFMHNVGEAFRGCTSFIVAHRLATVRHADLILVLDRGSVVERGTHAELMARGGLYYHLGTLQLAS